MSNSAAQENIARSIVSTLERKGIKLLALDFDKTIVSVHTAGHWRQGTPKLAEHVRPCFQALIKEALLSPNIQVCVVTYSMQPTLIHDVLKMALPSRWSFHFLIILKFIFLRFFVFHKTEREIPLAVPVSVIVSVCLFTSSQHKIAFYSWNSRLSPKFFQCFLRPRVFFLNRLLLSVSDSGMIKKEKR